MVFNQLLWSMHSKVICKLQKGLDYLDANEVLFSNSIPADTKVFIKYVQEILHEYKLLKDFITVHCAPVDVIDTSDINFKGFYLEAFCEGVFTVLENLDESLYKIEMSYLCSSGISMLQIRNEFVHLTNVISSLRIAVEKLKEEKYRGCKILDLCNGFINSESPHIKEIFMSIQQSCLKRFYMQIKFWLIQTVLHDPYQEFFIKTSNNCSSTINSEIVMSLNSMKCSLDSNNDLSPIKYEVNADNLPLLIPFSVAVKLLFIGESLIMCQHNEINSDHLKQHLDDCGISPHNILSQFSEIEKSETFNLRAFSNFIDNLWVKVNSYIRQISDEIGNVSSELVLMWEIYLLGRDELFQEFLLRGSHLLNSDVTVVSARNLNVALRDAVYYVYLTENCSLSDHFYFKLPNRRALKLGLTVWSVMFLDSNIKWPLHYLFTPDVMNIYNKLFCFLLRLKKAQMDLTTACKGIQSIQPSSLRMEFVEVKIHLLSIVSNLQNYCLTYVIANEMNLLLTSVKKATMFTDLQKSLLLFLTNICYRLFLFDKIQNIDKSNVMQTDIPETISNKVNKCFMKIFGLCGLFSELINGEVNDNDVSELSKLKVNLFKILKLLFSLLNQIDHSLYHNYNDALHIYTYLYHLIMCLDYNKFYHNKFQLDSGY